MTSRDATGWLQRGDLLLSRKQYEDALEAFNSAVAMAPQDATAWRKRGYALSNLGRYSEAVTAYEHALASDPDDAVAWGHQAYALKKLGQNEHALESYDRALTLDPSRVQAWVGKAGALYNLGRYDEAVAAGDEAVRLDPSEPTALTMQRHARAAVSRSVPDQRMRLRDGRWLAYLDYGDPHGMPILACHGSPGSRLDFPMEEEPLHRLHVRLIVPDRPGYGRSDLPAHFRILDWPSDVEQLLDHLGIARCAVLGVSGGGAYAAACAYALPQRVSRSGLVSSAAPKSIPEVAAALPRVERWQVQSPLLRLVFWPRVRGECWRRAWISRGAPVGWYYEAQLESGGPWDAFKRAMSHTIPLPPTTVERIQEPFRAGSKGHARDIWIVSQDWGFPLSAIVTSTHLWHGEQDRHTPLVMGQCLARTIPHCEARFYPDEGHNLLVPHWEEVLATLVT